MTAKQAIVLHSGGMDSSICLALAIKEFGASAVLSLGFAYGQRHYLEILAAERICQEWGIERTVLDLSIIQQLTDNALINWSLSINDKNTLVVGRNGLMARLSAILAHALGVHHLFMGVIECDAAQTGYRDCSRAYFDLKEQILRLDLNDPLFTIHTPLVKMTKKETLVVADQLGILDFLLKETVTCYAGISCEPCGQCHACRLREAGLREFYAVPVQGAPIGTELKASAIKP